MESKDLICTLGTEGDMHTNWKLFRRKFLTYIDAYHAEAKEKQKIGMLLHHGGDYCQDIYETFECSKDETLKSLLEKFDGHFIPKTNITYERYKIFTRKQQPEEAFEQYVTALKRMSQSCNFGQIQNELVRDLFICGINNPGLQRQLLGLTDLTLDKALTICRNHAVVDKQVIQMEKPEPDIKKEVDIDLVKKKTQNKECQYCGYTHDYGKCPAYGKTCAICKKKNHFAKKCKNKKVNILKETSESDMDYNVAILSLKRNEKYSWYCVSLKINMLLVNFKIDTGAQCNILSEKEFLKLGLSTKNLQKTNVRITSFTNGKVPVIGKCILNCHYKSNVYSIEFYVIGSDCYNLLGLESSERLGLIKRVDQIDKSLDSVIPDSFKDLFDGNIGCVPCKIKLEVNENVKPVVSPARRLPYSLMPKVKEELDNLVKMGIITSVSEPTDWVSQMVVVKKKDGSLRICLDPRPLNKALKRAHFPFPKIEDITARLAGAKVYCKLDAQSAFWMCPLDDNSSRLCTFQTEWGRYRFLRLPFGISPAPEIFHKVVHDTFQDIDQVATFQDDVLCWAESENELQHILCKVLNRAKENKIKFNPQKCQFFVNEVTFLGHIISKNGVSVDKEKVKAVKELEPPKDKKALQRVLGMFNYVSKFIPGYADITAPLRNLLKTDVDYRWEKNHDSCFEQLKNLLTNAPVLAFYQPEKELTLSVDASSVGLGAVLLQEGRPIAYSSKALTDVQMRYSQIEKELLAICFGVEKFKQYLIGRNSVRVETDHKPILGVMNKALCKVPARLQRMMMRLQPYRLNVVYTPGKYLYIADTLSRDFSMSGCDLETDLEDDIELQICLLLQNLPVTAECWDRISKAAEKDIIMSKLKTACLSGWPKFYKDVDDSIKPYYQFQEEIVLVKDLLFIGNRIIIPRALRHYMLKSLHTGHPGISRMMSRAELTMYWPGIAQDIKKFVRTCHVCQKYQDNKQKMVLKYKKVPMLPWQEVGCDIFEFKQKQYLVVVDALSNYIEVGSLKDLRSVTVINQLKSVFARHGVPLLLYSDGGLCFDSELFKSFEKDWGFMHIKSSPHYPKSNGLAESAVKIVKKIFQKAEDANEDPLLALLNQRNTPRGKVNSPASILMGRQLRTNIPCSFVTLIPKLTYDKDRKILNKQKTYSKKYYDKTATKREIFKEGQLIRYKKNPTDKIWLKGKILKKSDQPRSYMVENEEGKRYWRNEIFIRPSEVALNEESNIQNTQTVSDHNEPLGSSGTEYNIESELPNSNQKFIKIR
ncbi:hypothetical protein K1T71_000217 [Dendrolimus kikuchii]|uniref:Uncharacterized protein n=1 Tax=Dendrolimus kikuchii TaxID=765133 RepID=A0ACC1DIJ7_9NEOP|nr:hypothetical protein K1T71_000217 [Dendrolimus kikuchii]